MDDHEFIEKLNVGPEEKLVQRVLLQILTDVESRDVEAAFILLSQLPEQTLEGFLSEADL